MNCTHEFKEYVGLTDTFDYCTKCNKKRSEIVADAAYTLFSMEGESFWDVNRSGSAKIPSLRSWLPVSITPGGLFGVNRSEPYPYQSLIPYGGSEIFPGEASAQVISVDREKGTIVLQLDSVKLSRNFEVGQLIDTSLAVFDDEDADEDLT